MEENVMGEGKLKTKLCTEGVIDQSQEERDKKDSVYNPTHSDK